VRPLLADAPPASGLVSFVVEGWQPQKLVDALAERSFQLRSLADPSCLRACTHVTSSDQEIDELVEQLQYLVKSP
jgi:L-cysteine/cystine lyase